MLMATEPNIERQHSDDQEQDEFPGAQHFSDEGSRYSGGSFDAGLFGGSGGSFRSRDSLSGNLFSAGSGGFSFSGGFFAGGSNGSFGGSYQLVQCAGVGFESFITGDIGSGGFLAGLISYLKTFCRDFLGFFTGSFSSFRDAAGKFWRRHRELHHRQWRPPLLLSGGFRLPDRQRRRNAWLFYRLLRF